MEKSAFSPLGEAFRAKLVSMRKSSGLTQRELAGKLRREQSFVTRIEKGERRLDFIEFFWLCRACGVPPDKTAALLMQQFAKIEKTTARRRT